MDIITIDKEMINHQTFIIKQLFNMLDMKDVINELDKQTPYNLSNQNTRLINNSIEYTPYDIILEEPCIYGYQCFYKKTPYMCPRNHQTTEIIIKKGEIIPKYLCKYERPWKKNNNQEMRCTNMNCWFSHIVNHMYYVNYP